MTVNTLKIAKRLEDAGMPRPQCEALATVLDDEVNDKVVTHADLGSAVDRLESRMDRLDAKIDGVEQRLEAKIAGLDAKVDKVAQGLGARIDRLDDKLEASLIRVENTMWKVGFAMLGGSLAIGGLLLRFVR